MCLLECFDRGVAAARVQGDQRIAVLALPSQLDGDVVAECAPMRRPALRCVAVAVTGAGGGRGYNDEAQNFNQ